MNPTQLIQQYDNVISLGWICTVSNWLLSLGYLNLSSGVFDHVATPMWAVQQLIANNFDGFLDSIGQEKLFDNFDGLTTFDKRYFVRLSGTDATSDKFKAFCNRLKAQGAALIKLITEAKGTVMFVRQEEPATNVKFGKRLERPEFAQQYATSELDYLKQFVATVKLLNPTLEFKVLFLSSAGNFTDAENNIIGIPTPDNCDYRDSRIVKLMSANAAKQSAFLQAHATVAPKTKIDAIVPHAAVATATPQPKPQTKPQATVHPVVHPALVSAASASN